MSVGFYCCSDKSIKVHTMEDNQLLRSSNVSNLVSIYMYTCICMHVRKHVHYTCTHVDCTCVHVIVYMRICVLVVVYMYLN